MNCPSCGNTVPADARFCPVCGYAFSAQQSSQTPVTPPSAPPPAYQQPAAYQQPPAYQQPVYQQPMYQQPMVVQNPGGLRKPGKLQALAILALVDAILNFMAGFVWMLTICGIPLGIYAIVVGVFELLYALKILPDPIKPSKQGRLVAILQIVNIISGNIVSLVAGILGLIWANDPEVKYYTDTVAPTNMV